MNIEILSFMYFFFRSSLSFPSIWRVFAVGFNFIWRCNFSALFAITENTGHQSTLRERALDAIERQEKEAIFANVHIFTRKHSHVKLVFILFIISLFSRLFCVVPTEFFLLFSVSLIGAIIFEGQSSEHQIQR